jgi:transposase
VIFLVVTMGRLDAEAKRTMTFLARKGHSNSEVARLLGVTEGAVRYQAKRTAAGAVDGRSNQQSKAEPFAVAIADWHSQQEGEGVSLPALYAWLRDEHGYEGSLRSVQRYCKRVFPAPAIRARRRVETVIGAQAQVDWAEFPMVPLGNEIVSLSALVVTLSWCRKRAVIWSRSKCMLSWQSCHLSALQRLGGVPAVLRIDNVKTGVATGAGAWGKINETYRAFARELKFHVDACQPRHPQAKGKVERAVRDLRDVIDPCKVAAGSLEELQAETDRRLEARALKLRCPATGTSVAEAWTRERACLTPLPDPLVEPFDIVVRRPVGLDCLVSFEGRRYSVPFRFVRQEVEVRGLANRVLFMKNCVPIANHPRDTAALIVIDDAHFEGHGGGLVLPPLPLGRMGRRLQEIARLSVQQRSIDIYARLAEVAR